MKINIIRGILIILLIITFGVIFKFSSQTGTKSSGVSQKVTEVVTSNIKSIQEKIFSYFAISQKLLSLMGGTISVESEPGKGTDISVTFDIYREDEQS